MFSLQQETKQLATLISTSRQDSVFAQESTAGFNKEEIDRLIRGDGKAFRLKTGEVLIVSCLACSAKTEEKNAAATYLLRNALDDPGGEVCGYALLLERDEAELLLPSIRMALSLDGNEISRVLLVDDDEEVRPVIAVGFGRYSCRVIQARTLSESLSFCREHVVDIFASDVSVLRPHPMKVRQLIYEIRPEAKMLLISGYDQSTILQWYPGLLDGVLFVQKPFLFDALAPLLLELDAWKPRQQLFSTERGQPRMKSEDD
jgi:CheY-like chemotaxis protein